MKEADIIPECRQGRLGINTSRIDKAGRRFMSVLQSKRGLVYIKQYDYRTSLSSEIALTGPVIEPTPTETVRY